MTARLRSLDAFRGLTIAAMILVNNPGSWEHIYPPLEHAPWHGWTPTDLIFPFFLFIVGVSLVFSFTRRMREGARRGALLGKVFRRSLAIFAIGVALNFIPRFDPATVRYMGVLQRIALAYLVAACAWVLLSPRLTRWLCAVLLVGYWLLMTRLPVPGYGPGVLEPVGNLAQFIDSRVLAGHMWQPQWDPEGLLSTLPAIATCLLGAFTGEWLTSPRLPAERAAGMAVWGAGALAAGWAWSFWFPINKNLWTSSYVLFTAGLALLLFASLYWIIDIRKRERWATPWFVFGANALLAFVLSGLGARLLLAWRVTDGGDRTAMWDWVYQHLFASWAGPLNGSLAFAVAYLLLWLGVMAVLYGKRWYVRL